MVMVNVKCNLITNLPFRRGCTLRLMTFPDPNRNIGMGPAGLKVISGQSNTYDMMVQVQVKSFDRCYSTALPLP